jgi:hypothetical protein
MTGSLGRGNILVFLRPSLAFEHPFESHNGLWRVGQVGSCFVRVILGWPAGPLDEVVEGAFDPSLVQNLFNFLLVLGIFQVRHNHKAIIVFSAAVILEELDGKNIVKSGVLIGKGKAIRLTADAF